MKRKKLSYAEKGQELNLVDTPFQMNGIETFLYGTAGTFRIMNRVAQGDKASERVGDQLTIQSIRVRGQIGCKLAPSITGHNTNAYVRIIVVQNIGRGFYTNGLNEPTYEEIFALETTGGLLDFNQYLEGLRPSRAVKHRVIIDELVDLKLTAIGELEGVEVGSYHQACFDFYRKLNHKVCRFNGPNEADIEQGALYAFARVVTHSSAATYGTVTNVNLIANCRTRFTDF